VPTQLGSDFSFETPELTPTAFVEHVEVELGERPTHVITMLHGIRDHGIWALDLQYHSRRNGLKVLIQPVSYGWLGAFPFLLRIGAHKIEAQVQKEFCEIFERYPDAIHSLVAHSNGTKVVSKIIGRLPFKYRHIIFCGSVCKRSEAPKAPHNAETVVNDCSPRDIWPLMAQIINPWNYEASGMYGFRHSGIEDRFFTVAHGGCLAVKHFEDFIIPIVLRNTLRLGEKPKSLIPYGAPAYVRTFVFLIILATFIWKIF
jgi:hypothetical protein